MSLILPKSHSSYELHKEDLYYWDGQVKHIGWLEAHNEDCDAHYMNSDMDLEK